MAQFPAFPLWTDAYLGDTTHLSTLEHGAYLLLLIVEWRSKDQTLPDDDVLLAKFSKLTSKQWKRVRPILEPFFCIESGRWVQLRLKDEWAAVRQHSEKQSRCAKSRWLKNKEINAAMVIPRQCQTYAPIPSPNPNHLDRSDQENKRGGELVSADAISEVSRIARSFGTKGGDELGRELERIFLKFITEEPRNPDAAFISWAKKWLPKHHNMNGAGHA